jgi:hypothetical protein
MPYLRLDYDDLQFSHKNLDAKSKMIPPRCGACNELGLESHETPSHLNRARGSSASQSSSPIVFVDAKVTRQPDDHVPVVILSESGEQKCIGLRVS